MAKQSLLLWWFVLNGFAIGLQLYTEEMTWCSVLMRQIRHFLALRNAGVLFEDIRIQDPPDERVPPQQQGGGSERGGG